MTQLDLKDTLVFAQHLAKQAGELVANMRSEGGLEQNYKGGIELVTQADTAADELISQAIAARYPDHQILSEESNNDYSAIGKIEAPLWIVDPIDGTVNYAHGHQMVGISIGLAVAGEIVLGVVHNPFMKETFFATKKGGAFLQQGDQPPAPIHCGQKDDLGRAIVATGFPYKKDNLPQLTARVAGVLTQCADIRRLGSAALDMCWVACGRVDLYYEHYLNPWDMAAGFLIAREAGAVAGHIYAPPVDIPGDLWSRDALVANGHLFEPMQRLLHQADDSIK